MRPFVVFGKVRQEGGSGDGACGAAADVLQIGEIGFELLLYSGTAAAAMLCRCFRARRQAARSTKILVIAQSRPLAT